MIRKLVLGLALLLCVAAGLSASGSQPAATEDTGPARIVILASDGNNPWSKEITAADPYIKEMSRLSGYDVVWEYLDHNNWSQLLTLRFASGDISDVVRSSGIADPAHVDAVDNGVFLQLNTLLDRYGPNIRKGLDPEVWKNPNIARDGKIYGIPKVSALPATRVVYVRQDYLDRLGIRKLETYDEYMNFFAQVKKTDLNGNGQKDEVGFGVRENLGYSELWFGYFDAFPGTWYIGPDGKIAPSMLKDGMKDAMRVWKTMYTSGYVNEDMFSKTGSEWIKDIQSGIIALWLHDVQNCDTTWNPVRYNSPDARMNMLPGPKNPKGEVRLHPKGLGLGFIHLVNAKTKYPTQIVKLFDWCWSDDDAKETFFSFGVEGRNYTVQDGKIAWDSNAPNNVEKTQMGFYQVQLSLNKDYRMSPKLVALSPRSELINRGIAIAASHVFEHVDVNMPRLETEMEFPELGKGGGSLFMDMFAKVITGREDLDAAFETFKKEWLRRGGANMIAEAQAWYGAYSK